MLQKKSEAQYALQLLNIPHFPKHKLPNFHILENINIHYFVAKSCFKFVAQTSSEVV